MDKEEFAHIRKDLGLTQIQLAKALSVNIWTIQRYEQGIRSIPRHISDDLRDPEILAIKLKKIEKKP